MNPLLRHLTLRVATPSPLLSLDKKLDSIVNQTNSQFDQLVTLLRNLFGTTDEVIPFDSNLDVQNHRILNLADPEAEMDATNRRFVLSLTEQLKGELEEIENTIHNELPAGGQSLHLQRVLPTTIDDTIDIGTFSLINSTHAFDITVTVADTGFSSAKAWTIVTCASINAGWEIALPLVDSGPFGGSFQDYALDVKQTDIGATLQLRLRRTGGAVAGTANIQITLRGIPEDQFTESEATASVAAPTAILQSAILTVRDGQVGINANVLNYAGTGPTLMISGSEGGDNKAALAFNNPAPAAGTVIGEIRMLDNGDTVMDLDCIGEGADGGAMRIGIKGAGVALALGLVLTGTRNLLLGGLTAAGTNATKTLVISRGVAPTTSPADAFQMYSAVVGGADVPHFRTEGGDVIALFTGAALTASDGTLPNAVTRIGELEARLQAAGLLA